MNASKPGYLISGTGHSSPNFVNNVGWRGSSANQSCKFDCDTDTEDDDDCDDSGVDDGPGVNYFLQD